MSEMTDRLNELASRGNKRGFDAVMDAATRRASMGVVDGDSEPRDTRDEIPYVSDEPSPRSRPRRRSSRVLAAAGVAALLMVGSLAVTAIVGSGGAGSPEAAVRRLADAIGHGDPLAAADVLAPSEVASLHGTLSAAERRAVELQLVEDAGAPLKGLDLSVDGLQVSTQELADGFVKVVIDAGMLKARTEKAKFSPVMQKVLRDSTDNSSDTDLATLAANQDLPTFVMVVREDGHWYVSAAYTVLEYIREVNHASALPHFGAGVAAVATLGASAPDVAVTEAVQALQRHDWRKIAALVPPNEIPLYDYADVLNEIITKSDLQQSTFTISKINATSDIDGDTAKVVLHASGTADSGTWSLDGGCFTPATDGPEADSGITPFCIDGDQMGTTSYGFFGLFGLYGGEIPQASSQAITVVRHEGRWFVSPVGTVLDVLDRFIARIDRRGLYTVLGIPDQLPADGSLRLGQGMQLDQQHPGPLVLSFEGHAGEQLLGLATAPNHNANSYYSPAIVTVYSPDGQQFGGLVDGSPADLPVDGTYKVVIARYGSPEVTVTIWDAADAPPEAKQPSGSHCTQKSSTEQLCTSFGEAATPLDPRGPTTQSTVVGAAHG